MIYKKLISCIDEQSQKKLQDLYPINVVYSREERYIDFCIELAKSWILQTLPNFMDDGKVDEKILALREEIVQKILELQKNIEHENVKMDEDSIMYAYFLYFSGILLLIKRQSLLLDNLKIFFKKQIEKERDNTIKHFYGFLTVYIDIVNSEVKDINVFNDLRNYLKDDKYYNNIIFNAIQKEHELMFAVLHTTVEYNDKRKIRIDMIFPDFEKQYNQNDPIDILGSIMESGLALLYNIAGNNVEREKILCSALKKFSENSFALVQHGYLSVSNKIVRKELQQEFDIVEAKKKFGDVINLIDEKKQFGKKQFHYFGYRIKFEAVLGLAYIDYKQGLGKNADKRYDYAESIIREHLSKDEAAQEDHDASDYLTCILYVNKVRNIIDNKVGERNRSIYDLFKVVFETFDNANNHIKDELRDIVALAYNNFGIYYLNEGLYDEAEMQFKKALTINDVNAHARYNLGVLYHRKGEHDRALTLFRNASYLDSKCTEANEALEKMNSAKRRGLGTEWLDWWWKIDKKSNEVVRFKEIRNKISLKRVFLLLLISIVIVTFVTFVYELYFQHIIYWLDKGNTKIDPSEVDENAFLVIMAMGIAITMLPFINKLKMGDIEIEVETAGYRPIAPTSITGGISDQYTSEVKESFFFPRFWY